MNKEEILKKFKQGLTIDKISSILRKQELEQYQKDKQQKLDEYQAKEEQFKEQKLFISENKKTNKKYKFTGDKIVVGKKYFPKKPLFIDLKKMLKKQFMKIG